MGITPDQRDELVSRARSTRRRAYAPYSDYTVGAALLAASGEVYEGVNVENAAYPAGMCAERTALFAAVTQGEREFIAIAVVTENGGTPCGSCRQALSEFGLAMVVVVADAEGKVVHEIPLDKLLPEAFGPSKLAHG
jgi:cytidine deaminase